MPTRLIDQPVIYQKFDIPAHGASCRAHGPLCVCVVKRGRDKTDILSLISIRTSLDVAKLSNATDKAQS